MHTTPSTPLRTFNLLGRIRPVDDGAFAVVAACDAVALSGQGVCLSEALDKATSRVPEHLRPARLVFHLRQGLGDGREVPMTAIREIV